MIILDTNVLSELLRPEPARQVERWLSAQDGAKVYFTTVGEAELRHGVAILPAGKRRNALTTAIEGLLDELTQDMGIHRNDGGHQDEQLVVPAY